MHAISLDNDKNKSRGKQSSHNLLVERPADYLGKKEGYNNRPELSCDGLSET